MQTVLLLHGAIGASIQLKPLSEALKEKYDVHVLDFAGHGGAAMPEEPFSIGLFAKDILAWMDAQSLDSVNIFGYSMGGYVGMYLAKHHPERVAKLITLATKFHWDPDVADKETGMLVPEKISEKLPAFAGVLEQRHAPNDWKLVLNKTSDMLVSMGADNPLKPKDYPYVKTPCLILLGDRDKMVSVEETIAAYRSIPAAQMAMLPATAHAIEGVNMPVLGFFIKNFLG